MTNTTTDDRVISRWYACGTFTLESVAHFGGGETGTVDMLLHRGSDGDPIIPGSSIAGAGRNYLARRLFPWDQYAGGDLHWRDLKLFGYHTEKVKGLTMSPLRLDDALLLDDSSDATTMRDGVRITSVSGVAATGAKFDAEVVARGAQFSLRFECVIRENDPAQQIEEQFCGLLCAFRDGEIRLGARTTRGWGCGRVANWKVAKLQMKKSEHILAWLEGGESPWAAPDALQNLPMNNPLPDNRTLFRLKPRFRLDTAILIREAQTGKDRPDFAHLLSAGKPVVPGTSFAGALRHRVEAIARTCWGDVPVVDLVLSEIFGPLHESSTPGQALWRSRVLVEEKLIVGGAFDLKERVAIDRFLSGALDHAKFNEEPWEPGKQGASFELEIILENPAPCEAALLLLALRDIWAGLAGIGGEAGLGRGLLRGERMIVNWCKVGKSDEWLLEPGKDAPFTCTSNNKDTLQKFVDEAKNPPTENYNHGSRRPELPSVEAFLQSEEIAVS